MNQLQNNNDLRQLARKINDRQRTIISFREVIEGHCRKAAPEMILQGRDLILAKVKVGFGLWLDWLSTNCPELPPRTAQHYMTLAKKAGAADLNEVFRLVTANDQALARDNGQESKAYPAPVEWLIRFSRLETLIKDCPINTWHPEQVNQAKEKLEPTARALWPEKFK